jgi:predicted nuclease of predicted toxin-antitoxin system
MAKLFADENFPIPAVDVLQKLHHDVLTIQETGQAGQSLPDEAVLAFAHSEGRALLTLNRKHFIHLHREGQTHSGIIVCTSDIDFSSLAQRIHQAIEIQGGLAGQLIRINRPLK